MENLHDGMPGFAIFVQNIESKYNYQTLANTLMRMKITISKNECVRIVQMMIVKSPDGRFYFKILKIGVFNGFKAIRFAKVRKYSLDFFLKLKTLENQKFILSNDINPARIYVVDIPLDRYNKIMDGTYLIPQTLYFGRYKGKKVRDVFKFNYMYIMTLYTSNGEIFNSNEKFELFKKEVDILLNCSRMEKTYMSINNDSIMKIESPKEETPIKNLILNNPRFTYGKYRGMKVMDVYMIDKQYIDWFQKNIIPNDIHGNDSKIIMEIQNIKAVYESSKFKNKSTKSCIK